MAKERILITVKAYPTLSRTYGETVCAAGIREDGSWVRLSKLQILGWEVGALFWNCMKACDKDEACALEKVRAKYWDEFMTKDLHFFLGTTQQFHFVAPNPWVVIWGISGTP